MHRLRINLGPWDRVVLAALGLTIGVATSTVSACSSPTTRVTRITEFEEIGADTYQLRVHLTGGDLLLLQSWELDDDARILTGTGLRFDDLRINTEHGEFAIAYDTILLTEGAETDSFDPRFIPWIGVAGGVSLAVSVICITNPKTCFGSCPTFYVPGDDAIIAEGFSSSVLSALEEADLDTLGVVSSGEFSLVMRNEAFETHHVRDVTLVAVPAGDGHITRVGERFFATGSAVAPWSHAAELAERLSARDGLEWSSEPSPENLGERESLSVEFRAPPGPAVLELAARKSLVDTFLFYTLIDALGPHYGEWLATMEAGTGPLSAEALGEALDRVSGSIRIRSSTGWIGDFSESGPLAVETVGFLVEVPEDGVFAAELELARGGWRIDQLVLRPVHEERFATDIAPTRVEPLQATSESGHSPTDGTALGAGARAAMADAYLQSWLDGERSYLRTLPGDEVVFSFRLPEAPHALFLRSTGHYHEWTREPWIQDSDLGLVARTLADPSSVLIELAPDYAEQHDALERSFWESRFAIRELR